jgi:hypothetical protein
MKCVVPQLMQARHGAQRIHLYRLEARCEGPSGPRNEVRPKHQKNLKQGVFKGIEGENGLTNSMAPSAEEGSATGAGERPAHLVNHVALKRGYGDEDQRLFTLLPVIDRF